ncbi:RES domain-containing protein [Mesorhizobium waimense]|uniref:RES domain-containing protein n=1 Tax=Mesorhizobium waimense TaxID=1300307 RepID=A0A3A5K7E1_9HYPH|nr:RES family NAD+ phosphorylase [Mesorhizobium waimense]RJT30812.1 RES domain-containing protein [Mesorhizobium waimense]
MKLIPKKIRERIISARVSDWPRILPSRHRAQPAGAGFGSSRFSSPSRLFKILYAGEDFSTAFAEAVVRDRFEGKERRFLYRPRLDALCVTSISSDRELILVDLTGAGAYELGVDTDANRARDHRFGQEFSELLHDQMADVDGILFDSRLTNARCVAIYERALPALSGRVPIALLQAAELVTELKRLNITVRRERGFGVS